MAKSMGKKRKGRVSGRGKTPRLPAEGRETPVKYVGYLLELHKLQGVLLNKLNKIIR